MDSIHGRTERTEQRISEPKGRIIGIIKLKKQEKTNWEKIERSHRDWWVYNKSSNIPVAGVPKGVLKGSGVEMYWKD